MARVTWIAGKLGLVSLLVIAGFAANNIASQPSNGLAEGIDQCHTPGCDLPAVRMSSAAAGVGEPVELELKAVLPDDLALGVWTIWIEHDNTVLLTECDPRLGSECRVGTGQVMITGARTFDQGLRTVVELATLAMECQYAGTAWMEVTVRVFASDDVQPQALPPPVVHEGQVACEDSSSTGNVDCSPRIDAIDASLILQFSAGLASQLPCQENGDSNRDGRIDPLDSSILLQYGSGLLAFVPPLPPGPTVSLTSNPGPGIFDTTLRITSFGRPGLGSWTVDLSYDPHHLRITRCRGRCDDRQAKEGVITSHSQEFEPLLGDARLMTFRISCTRIGRTEISVTIKHMKAASSDKELEVSVLGGSYDCQELR